MNFTDSQKYAGVQNE